MAQGKDLRIQRTEKALCDSFTTLMEEVRYEDITIGALCDRALIRRATFYKHYSDKDDFFRFYMTRIRDEFLAKNAACSCEDDLCKLNIHMYNELADFFIEHERLINNIFRSSAMSTLILSFSEFASESLAQSLRCAMENDTTYTNIENPEAFAAFVAGGMIDSLIHWWTNGRRDADRMQITRILERLYS